jgi:hypothetical protein
MTLKKPSQRNETDSNRKIYLNMHRVAISAAGAKSKRIEKGLI